MDQQFTAPSKRPSNDMEPPPAKRVMQEPGCPTFNLRCLVSSTDAGGIIGKGGNFIKRLREESGAGVLLPDSLGAPERILCVNGGIDIIGNVMQQVLPKIGEFDRKAAVESGKPFNGQLQLLIAEMQVGSIIGRAGFRIKELRESTGAFVKIHSDCLPNSEERLVVISGPDDNIINCLRKLLAMVSENPLRSQPHLYDPSSAYGGDYHPSGRGRGYGRGGRGQSSFGGYDGGHGRGGRRDGGRGGNSRGGFSRGMARGDFDSSYGPGPTSGGVPPSLARGRGMGRAVPPGASWNNPSSHGIDGAPGDYGRPSDFGGNMPPMDGGGDFLATGPPGPVGPADDGTKTEQVTIPSEYAGAIIGPSGSRIKQVREDSHCTIKIDDARYGSADRVITITGQPENIRYAQHLMQQSVYNHMNSRGASGSGRGGSSRGGFEGREQYNRPPVGRGGGSQYW